MSVIFLGQNSIQVGIEIEKLASRFNVAHDRLLFVDNDIQTENKSIVHLCRCASHLVFDPSDGCRFCASNVDLLLYHLTSLFSEVDCTQSSVVFVDMSSAFGVWSLRIVLRFINHHYPFMNMYCILRKPNNVRIQGLEHFYAVLNIQMALEYCTNVFVRGHNSVSSIQTAATVQEGPTTVDVDAGLSDSTLPSVTACDAFVLLLMTTWSRQTVTVPLKSDTFNNDSISYLPELALCCNGQQVIDLRSSCQKIVKLLFHTKVNKVGGSKLSDYNALRSCISSLHHTHQSYAMEYPDYSLWGVGADNLKDNDAAVDKLKVKSKRMVVYGPNFVNLYVSRMAEHTASKRYAIATSQTSLIDPKGMSATNISALNAATPNIRWILDNQKELSELRLRQSNSDLADDMTVDSYSTNATGTTRITARTAVTNNSDGIASRSTSDQSSILPICAIVFESIYAKHDIREVCQRTKTLINVGAYTHLFDGTSISVQDIVDAMTYIEDKVC